MPTGSLHRQKRRARNPRTSERPTRSSTPTSPDAVQGDKNGQDVESDGCQAPNPAAESPAPSLRKRSNASVADDRGPHHRRTPELKIHDFSFILHPSHDVSTPDNDEQVDSNDVKAYESQLARQQACFNLRLSDYSMARM